MAYTPTTWTNLAGEALNANNLNKIETGIQTAHVTADAAVVSTTLAGTGGAGLVGFIQSGTGADARTVAEKLAESVSVKDFGAVGDGVTDDTAAIQAALDIGGRIDGVAGDVYLITSTLTVSDNTIFDLRGASLKRGWRGDWLIENSTSRTTNNNSNIEIRNAKFTDKGEFESRGNFLMMSGVTGLRLSNITINPTSPYDANMGSWCCYISGEDVVVDQYVVDSEQSGLFSDGIHLGYVKNFTLSNFNIKAGDDGIALHHPPEASAWEGAAGVSENITITGGVVSSVDANGIRIGAWGSAITATPSDPDSSWKNVTVSDVTFGPCGNTCVQLFDNRDVGEITTPNNYIRLSNLNFGAQDNVRLINIAGNPDISDSANYTKKNFTNIEISGASGTQTSTTGQLVRAGGVESLILGGLSLTMDLASPAATTALELKQITSAFVLSSDLFADNSGSMCSISYVNETTFSETRLHDSLSFNAIALVLNADIGQSLYMYGGSIVNCVRGINKTGTGAITDFVTAGTYIDASTSVTAITSADVSGAYVFSPINNVATSDGTTGGTGSAGAGNQYVEIDIGGVTYKVLHDGTV